MMGCTDTTNKSTDWHNCKESRVNPCTRSMYSLSTQHSAQIHLTSCMSCFCFNCTYAYFYIFLVSPCIPSHLQLQNSNQTKIRGPFLSISKPVGATPHPSFQLGAASFTLKRRKIADQHQHPATGQLPQPNRTGDFILQTWAQNQQVLLDSKSPKPRTIVDWTKTTVITVKQTCGLHKSPKWESAWFPFMEDVTFQTPHENGRILEHWHLRSRGHFLRNLQWKRVEAEGRWWSRWSQGIENAKLTKIDEKPRNWACDDASCPKHHTTEKKIWLEWFLSNLTHPQFAQGQNNHCYLDSNKRMPSQAPFRQGVPCCVYQPTQIGHESVGMLNPRYSKVLATAFLLLDFHLSKLSHIVISMLFPKIW